MKGFITEKNWEEVEEVFPQVHEFYSHLPKKPDTFLELLELYHSFDNSESPSNSSLRLGEPEPLKRQAARRARGPWGGRAADPSRVGKHHLILIFLLVVASLFVPKNIQALEDSVKRVDLKLTGAGCDDMNAIESVILHQGNHRGEVIETNIQAKKGHIIVDYDSDLISPQQFINALIDKKGCVARVNN